MHGLADHAPDTRNPSTRRVFPVRLPSALDAADPRLRDCYIVIGNHDSHVGIVESLYALSAYFSRHYRVFLSESIIQIGRAHV